MNFEAKLDECIKYVKQTEELDAYWQGYINAMHDAKKAYLQHKRCKD